MADTPAKPKLLDFAKSHFSDLSLAEQKLFDAAAEGKDADCREDSGKRGLIRTDLLSWLCTDRDASAQVTYRGVSIIGAQIDGELNLEWAKVSFPLRTRQCVFTKAIILQNSHVVSLDLADTSIKDLRAEGVIVERSVILCNGFKCEGSVNLVRATIGGYLLCVQGQFISADGLSALDANNANIHGDVFLSRGFRAEGGVDLSGATIGGGLVCSGGQFVSGGGKTALDASFAKIQGNVSLHNGFRAEGGVELGYATIDGELSCIGSQFFSGGEASGLSAFRAKIQGDAIFDKDFQTEGGVYLVRATIGGNLHCGQSRFVSKGKAPALEASDVEIHGNATFGRDFKAEGGVSLVGANIDGDLLCTDSQFFDGEGKAHALNAGGVKIQGNVVLFSGFRAEGEVNLAAATIHGNLQCVGGQFLGKDEALALDANGAKIDGSVVLSADFRAEGGVNLGGTTIGGNLECNSSLFVGKGHAPALNAHGAKIDGSAFFYKMSAEGEVSFSYASVVRDFQLRDVKFSKTAILNLQSAEIGTLSNDQNSWPSIGNLFISDFVYDHIDDRAFLNVDIQLGWLHRQPQNQFSRQPYEQLATVLRQKGLYEQAREVMIQMNKDHGKLLHWRPAWFWYGFFGKLIGYGYSPWSAFTWSLIVIGIGWLFFQLGNDWKLFTPTGDKAYVIEKDGARRFKNEKPQISEDYPKFNAFVYSVETFVPLLKLGIGEHWAPNANLGLPLCSGVLVKIGFPNNSGSLLRYYMWLHIILGWILGTLWIGALTGILKK